MVIEILNHVEKCYSNDDGKIIFNIIKDAFDNNRNVVVSFSGVTSLNSSFVNSAFIELLEWYDFSYIKDNLQFKNSTKQINTIIKERFRFEVNRKRMLVTT